MRHPLLTLHPLQQMFCFFLNEYKQTPKRSDGITQFYYELSLETFQALQFVGTEELEGQSISITPSHLLESFKIENNQYISDIRWSDWYVPLKQNDSIPFGKAILRKKFSPFKS